MLIILDRIFYTELSGCSNIIASFPNLSYKYVHYLHTYKLIVDPEINEYYMY